MNTNPIPLDDYQEAAMVLEAQERDTAEAWGRISALALVGAATLKYFGQKLTQPELQRFVAHMTESTPPDMTNDFALLNGALGFNKRNRWNG
jgi:hypothetical protein